MTLLKLKNAAYSAPENPTLVNEYAEYDLAGKWRHGWIPLNPEAVAIKNHKAPGGGGKSRLSTSTTRPSRLKLKGASAGSKAYDAKQAGSRRLAGDLAARGESPKPSELDNFRLDAKPAAKSGKVKLERTLPNGTVKSHNEAMTHRQAAQAAMFSLHDNGVATKSEANKFAAKVEDAKVGETVEHPSGYKFRKVSAEGLTRTQSMGSNSGMTSNSESLDEIAKRNMGSDLTKAKSSDLRTYSQFGHQGSKDELKRRSDKREASKAANTAKLQQAAQDRTRANINRERAKDEAAGFDKMSDAELRELGSHNGAAHAELQKRLAMKTATGRPLFNSPEEKARLDAADARTKAAMERSDGKVQVYNTETGRVERVTPAEANAGHARYGQSLGAGSAAAGQTVKNALEAEQTRRMAEATSKNEDVLRAQGKVKGADGIWRSPGPKPAHDPEAWRAANARGNAKAQAKLEAEKARRAALGRPGADSFTGETRMETLKRTAADLKARGASQSAARHRREMRTAANDLTGRDARTMSDAEKTRAAEQMFGSDRSKWSAANLRSAAKAGDADAIAELSRRVAKARKSAPKVKQNAATLKGRKTPVTRGTNSIGGVRFNRGEGGMGK